MKLLFLITSFCLLSHLTAGPVSGQRRALPRRQARVESPKPKPQRATQGSTPRLPALSEIRNDADVQDADVAIIATVTARELLFEVVGTPVVEFSGQPARETLWQTKRYNLPERLEPGVTYRDIGIQLKIVSRFEDIERIVAEALGEIPIADEGAVVEIRTKTPTVSPGKEPSKPRDEKVLMKGSQ